MPSHLKTTYSTRLLKEIASLGTAVAIYSGGKLEVSLKLTI